MRQGRATDIAVDRMGTAKYSLGAAQGHAGPQTGVGNRRKQR